MPQSEKSQQKSKRDMFRERFQQRHPDVNMDDDEAFYGQMNDDFDSQENDLKGYKEREKSFSDMFTSDPRSAAFITAWRKGEDPAIGFIRQFGDDLRDALDDPEKQEALAQANKEYVERVEKSKKLDAEYDKNIVETLKYLDEQVQSGKMSEQQIDDAMELLVKICHDGIVGKFSPETIDMAVKALNHDKDVEEADYEGEVRGRNTKIDEKLAKGKRGDGMPNLNGKNGGTGKPQRKPSIFTLAEAAQ